MPVSAQGPTRVALVGAGYFGRFHLDAWTRLPDVSLVAIVEADRAVGESAAAEVAAKGLPAPALFEDAAALIAAMEVDLIDITAPPPAHLALIRALAPSGADLICQKPFCGGTSGAKEAVAAAQQAGVRLAVHENIRFQPWHREAKRLLSDGALGEPYQATFRLRPGDGRGPEAYLARQPYFQTMPRFLVHETAVHWLDLFRYFFGEPTSLTARLMRRNPAIAGEDSGVILVDFPDGARGLFDGDRLLDHGVENPRLTMGEMSLEGDAATLRLDGRGRLFLRSFRDTEEREHRYDWRDHLFGGDCVHACCQHILDAWRRGETPETDAAGYLKTMALVDAAYESADAGATVPLSP